METLTSGRQVKYSPLLFISILFLDHSKIFASEEHSEKEKHVQFASAPTQNYEICPTLIPREERRQVMEIIEPGSLPSLNYLPTSMEEVRQKSIEIWQNYTMDECIGNLIQASEILKRIAIYCHQNSSKVGRSYYTALYQVALTYWGAFRMLKNGSMEVGRIIDSLEEWFSKYPKWSSRRDVLYAIEQKFRSEVQARSMDSGDD
jgi:hypothetical protein